MSNSVFVSFTNAGLMGLAIMFGLGVGSIYAWAVFLAKRKQLKVAKEVTEVFKKHHNESGSDMNQFLKNPMWRHWELAPLPRVYQKIAREVQLYLSESQLTTHHLTTKTQTKLNKEDIEILEKTIDREISEEIIELQSSLNILATTASVAPLAGLLGTVWGIMVTFVDMSHQGSANIATVAPGISQALITTIFGLVVAIPALVFYNVFNHRINLLALECQNFMSSFVTQLERRYLKL